MSSVSTISFCDHYIEKLVDFIEAEYLKKDKDLSRLVIVFGGKRPFLFLKRELARRIKQSFVSPQFFTIDQFASHIVKEHEAFQNVVDLDHCYLLYHLAKKSVPEILKGRETFAQFLPWTRELIKFIDHVDLELIEDAALLNIKANAEIGYAVPDDINRLLVHIVKLRQLYHAVLEKNKTYSRGFQYRRAAELIEKTPLNNFDQILFCNFFYFHASEEKIVRTLYERGQGTLIFQGDERKWPVLKRLAKSLGTPLVEGLQPDPTHFQLKLYAGFDVHSQVGLIREILAKVNNHDQTVIVLPNPANIIPLLSEITTIAKDFNISMGYPLRRSSLYTLLTHLFQAQLSRKQNTYYAKDYLKVLRHPFVKNFRFVDDPTVCRALVHKIEEILTGKEKADFSGSSFVELKTIEASDKLYDLTAEMLKKLNVVFEKDDLRLALRAIHDLFLRKWEKLSTFGNLSYALSTFLDELTVKSSMERYPLNLNIAQRMYEIAEELKRSSFQAEPFLDEDLFKILDSNIAGEMIAFAGSPLKGLQILGLFETRSLNFENVIVLDVNEGMLPNLNIYEPLIPREVMISLGLNRLEMDEEIQRYLFMRLISSAKHVHLVYQENKEKEKSRFVEELLWEEEKKKNALGVIPVTRASFMVKAEAIEKRVKKTPAMIEMLKRHTYSASSLNMYLRNPMEFYTNYVLGLREQEDLLDEPEARHVGTFVHQLLEEAFRPFLNKQPIIDSRFRARFLERFEQKFSETFALTMGVDAFLLKSVLSERLNRFLDNEEKNPERNVKELLYLEQKFEETITLSCGNIRFGYVVDRVDRMSDGTVMVIDYKTGGVNLLPKAFNRVEMMELSREEIRDTIRSFQIPLYFHYLDGKFSDEPINAALYNLRTFEVAKFIDAKANLPRAEIKKLFLKSLDFIVSEILDPKVDFVEDNTIIFN